MMMTTAALMAYFLLIYLMLVSGDLFFFWTIMEAQTLMFIALMFLVSNSIKNFTSPALYYLLIQGLGSVLFILYLALSEPYSDHFKMSICLIFLLFFKGGLIPFHLWVLELTKMCSYYTTSILITVHKIPFIYLMVFSKVHGLLIFMAASSLYSTVLMMKSKTVTQLMVMSSLYLNMWMYFLCAKSLMMLIAFSFAYLVANMVILSKSMETFWAYVMYSFFLGLPPLPMFTLKVETLNHFINSMGWSWVIILTLTVVMSIFGYLKAFFKMDTKMTTDYSLKFSTAAPIVMYLACVFFMT